VRLVKEILKAGKFGWKLFEEGDVVGEKISDFDKYNNLNSGKYQFQKRVTKICKDTGEILAIYDKIVDVKTTSGNVSEISSVCKGKGKTTDGYAWKYTDDTDKIGDIRPELIVKSDTATCIKVSKICKETGKVLETYTGIREASRKNNISPGVISGACNGKQKSAGGFFWKYDDIKKKNVEHNLKNIVNSVGSTLENSGEKKSPNRCSHLQKKVAKICLDTRKILEVYNGIKEAAKITGINSGSIVKVCKSVRPTAGGFSWKYYENE
jgi:hypothetical protein